MKKIRNSITLVCLFVLTALTIGLFFGCGQSGTTSSTTAATTSTLTTGASVGSVAQNVASIATNLAGVSSVSNALASFSGVGIMRTGIKAKSAPPSSFLSTLSSDGWVTVPYTGATIEVRFYTKDGHRIDSSFLADKKVASIEGFDWSSLATGNSIEAAVAILNLKTKLPTWLTSSPAWSNDLTDQATFYTSNKYRTCLSLFDYLLWAYVSPVVKGALIQGLVGTSYPAITSFPYIATPEASAPDRMGTNEAQVNGTVNGATEIITLSTSLDATGKPVSVSGSGTIVNAQTGTATITFTLVLDSSGAILPTSQITIVVGSPTNTNLTLSPTYDATTGAFTGWSGDMTGSTTGKVVVFASPDASGHNGYFLPTGGNDPADRQYF